MRDWKQEARDAWDAPSWHEAAVASVKANSHPHPTSDNRSSIGHGKSPPRKNWSDRVFSAADLQTQTFPPLKFIVPELVPEGATLLVSRPKLGKSWLVLDIAIAVASGRFTLDSMKPIQGDVLYLALEDGPRRLQRRLTKLLPTFGEKWPPRLKFATECPKADQGGLNDIEQWISTVEAPRLVIVDTLAQFRKAPNGKAQVYTEDYGAIAELQKLASKHSLGIVIVHHDRKMEADDVFDTVSGSLGLTGAADTILIMKRQAGSVTLHVFLKRFLRLNRADDQVGPVGRARTVIAHGSRQHCLIFIQVVTKVGFRQGARQLKGNKSCTGCIGNSGHQRSFQLEDKCEEFHSFYFTRPIDRPRKE